jgi:hypothetical protein
LLNRMKPMARPTTSIAIRSSPTPSISPSLLLRFAVDCGGCFAGYGGGGGARIVDCKDGFDEGYNTSVGASLVLRAAGARCVGRGSEGEASVAPSSRQKFNVSSAKERLQVGQIFTCSPDRKGAPNAGFDRRATTRPLEFTFDQCSSVQICGPVRKGPQTGGSRTL